MKIEVPNPARWRCSERSERLQSSFIREILKLGQQPEIISFAGGLPSPMTFPVEEMRQAFDKVLSRHGRIALQYGPTDGYLPLRQWIADSLSAQGARVMAEQVLMTSGSQQALDLLAKVLIDKKSRVLVETPTYLGALQAFSLYGPEIVSVATDDHGLVPSSLKQMASGARLLYALPNFQNPTGRTLSLERRYELVDICIRFGVPVIEDDPYGALSYKSEPLPKLVSIDPDGVIYLGSFSKVLTPGIRLGYLVAPLHLMRRLELAKQATDLHTSELTQMVVHEVIKDGFLERHIPNVRSLYGSQCRAMLDAMARYFPDCVKWTKPEGGMFTWVTLPKHIDATQLLDEAVARNVAFVPGLQFYGNQPETNTLRLSFVTVSPERLRAGIQILGELIAAQI